MLWFNKNCIDKIKIWVFKTSRIIYLNNTGRFLFDNVIFCLNPVNSRKNFFQDKELFLKNFDFNYKTRLQEKNNRCKNQIEDKNEKYTDKRKIYIRFSDTVFRKIYFMVNGPCRDHPSMWVIQSFISDIFFAEPVNFLLFRYR